MLFRVFGVLEIDGADGRHAVTAIKPLRLLSMLLLRANKWVADDELRDVVWPAGAPPSARGNLKSYVSQLRQWFGTGDVRLDRIERGPGGYRINLDRGELDTWLFEDLVGKARAARHDGELTAALAHLTEALRLWRGEPFGLLETETAVAEVARLTELRWSARELAGEALLAADRAGEAVPLLRVMVTEDPLRERAWEHLMAALTRLGRRAEALNTYQRARRALVDELGIEPGPRLRELHERLLRDEPPPRPAPTPPGEPADLAAPVRRKRPRKVVAALGVTVALAAVLLVVVLSSDAPGNQAAPTVTTTSETFTTTTLPDGTVVSPRRPIPGIRGPGSTQLLFGIGDQANSAGATELVRETPTRMLTTWFLAAPDVARFASWRKKLIPDAYTDGYALHLIVANRDDEQEVPTDGGTGCGKPYPLTDDFLDHTRQLAEIFAGKEDDPPLFVTVFHGVNAYGCAHGDYTREPASTNYYDAIKKRYVQVREIFHAEAPNARVALGWRSWQTDYDDPSIGGGLSMFPYFEDELRISDFQSVFSWERGSNVPHVRESVRVLGRYGPVMLAQYADTTLPLSIFDKDLRTLLTNSSIADLTTWGLFAWNFSTEKLLDASPRTYDFVKDFVRRNGRPAQ